MKPLIFLLLIGFPITGFSQSRLLDIHSNHFTSVLGFDLKETSSGYLIAGTGSSNMNYGFFCWINKTDSEFNPIWSKKFMLSGFYYQVNPTTITISTLSNNQIVLLAKTRDEDSVYTDLCSFDQNGNFIWGKHWGHLFEYADPVDLNKIVPLSDSTFHISHSLPHGSSQMKVKADGTVLSSEYTHLPNPNDSVLGVTNMFCNDGGMLQIMRSHDRRTVLIKLDPQHQVSWAKEIQSTNRFIWIANAYENTDGSFWLFGSITADQSLPDIDQSLAVMKLSNDGNLAGAYYYDNQLITGIMMGIAQVYPIAPNEFEFNSTERQIGSINLNTGIIQAQNLDISQANHGFQNLHKLSNHYYAMTGMGLNWNESKIHIFPGITDHPCLYPDENVQMVSQDTIPLQEIQITDIAAVIESYSFGNSFNPAVESADISFVQECYLSLEEYESHIEPTIYPNPTDSNPFVTLKLSGSTREKIELTIFDLHGKEVFRSEIEENSDFQQIDIHTLQQGMYLIHGNSPDGLEIFTSKLIIR